MQYSICSIIESRRACTEALIPKTCREKKCRTRMAMFYSGCSDRTMSAGIIRKSGPLYRPRRLYEDGRAHP